MHAFHIERADRNDCCVLAPLFDAYRMFYGQPSDPDAALSFLRERLERRESIVFYASAEGRAAGFMQLYPTFSSIALSPALVLNDLFVAPAYRGCGIARALLARAESLARECGANGIALQTGVTNAAAHRLYESCGYNRDDMFYRYELPVDPAR